MGRITEDGWTEEFDTEAEAAAYLKGLSDADPKLETELEVEDWGCVVTVRDPRVKHTEATG